jgi:hypothetical protein
MNLENFLKTKMEKILMAMVLFFALLYIAGSGYKFGQWLHSHIN